MVQNFWKDKKGRYEVSPVTIETVDSAVFDYFDKKITIKVETERGRNKVPIIFASGERWKQVRDKKGLRDENGTLILPLITVRRTEIDRAPGFGGLGAEQPNFVISNVLHNETSNFQNILNARRDAPNFFVRPKKKVVREYLTIPYPDFSTFHYEITIWAQYEEQMNNILETIFYNYDYADSFVMPVKPETKKAKGDSYYFVGFREGNLNSQSNVEEFTNEERIIRYSYSIKVPVYLIMDPKDEALSYGDDPKGEITVFKDQSSIEVKLTEKVITLEDFEKLFG